jgi:hypothetical protein
MNRPEPAARVAIMAYAALRIRKLVKDVRRGDVMITGLKGVDPEVGLGEIHTTMGTLPGPALYRQLGSHLDEIPVFPGLGCCLELGTINAWLRNSLYLRDAPGQCAQRQDPGPMQAQRS